MQFLQGLWAQYGALVIAALVVFVLMKVFPLMRDAATKWLTKRKLPWLIPLIDGAFDMAEAAITVSGLGSSKRALAIGKLTEQLGRKPRAAELVVIDSRLAENAEADRKPLGSPSLQLNPGGGQSLAGAKFGPQP
jgi:hypothetical protein